LSSPPNANILWARILFDALRAGGVRHLCMSPGSRSAPLVLAARETDGIEISVHIDERSAAFFALGHAKATRRPTALVCTSGTAAANYLPAVCEASHAGTPMILLTADRPPELRFAGAPQTMDQRNLYGGFARGFHELPLPSLGTEALRALRGVARCALAQACGRPAGPVQINAPFREPLTPAPMDLEAVRLAWNAWRGGPGAEPHPTSTAPPDDIPPAAAVEWMRAARRPWIVAGPGSIDGDGLDGVLALARAWRAPVIADIASGLRFRAGDGDEVLAHGDLIARAIGPKKDAPDVVLRLGGVPTSKALNERLAARGCLAVAVQEDDRSRDPDGIVRETIVGRAGPICAALAREIAGHGAAGPEWAAGCARAERLAREMLAAASLPREAAAVRSAIGAMPEHSTIFLSNSMPIRWADIYSPSSAAGHDVFVNRGVNGIDGVISTALGAALGTRAPLLLVIGDLAFLHDLGGLQGCRWIEGPAAILLLNNNGGGIFANLPIARFPDVAVPLFETPHDYDLEPAARMFGLGHVRAGGPEVVAAAVQTTIETGSRRVIEVNTDRRRTANEHAETVRGVVVEIERAWKR